MFKNFGGSKSWIQEEFNVAAELLLTHILNHLANTLKQVLLHEMVMFEVVYISKVTQFLEARHNEVMHVFECTGFTKQENCTVRHFPRFFSSGEAVIHATTTSFEFWGKGTTTV